MIPQRPSDDLEQRPGFGATVATMLLPVVLMLAKALVDIVVDDPDERASSGSPTSSARR